MRLTTDLRTTKGKFQILDFLVISVLDVSDYNGLEDENYDNLNDGILEEIHSGVSDSERQFIAFGIIFRQEDKFSEEESESDYEREEPHSNQNDRNKEMDEKFSSVFKVILMKLISIATRLSEELSP